MKKKNQKPIELDINLKYKCPRHNCGCYHWLSLKETKVKNFKIVCDCGNIFKPKQIKKLKIIYSDSNLKNRLKQPKIIESSTIPVDIHEDCVKLLVDYGFTKDESCSFVKNAYSKNPINSASLLIKYILQNLEQLNVNN